MNVLSQKVVALNKLWQVVGETTVEEAIKQMVVGAATAIFIDGQKMVPLHWDDWVKLPVVEEDGYIRTPNMRIRRPTVIAMCVYAKFKHKTPKANNRTLAAMAGHRDEYTGKLLLNPKDWSRDHIDPLSRGGKDEPGNWAFTHKDLNNKKGSRTPEEMGLKRPKGHKLRPMPPAAFITPTHPDHKKFLKLA